jgi:hypothetical protein
MCTPIVARQRLSKNVKGGNEYTCNDRRILGWVVSMRSVYLRRKVGNYLFPELLVIRGGLISLWLYKENNKLRDWTNVFTLHILPWAPHTYDFVVLTSLTHPRKILLVVLQIEK